MADYRVLQADFRETLAAAEGQATLIAMSPPYPSSARTCYAELKWEDYQALGDAVKGALRPGGHCLMNLSAPVRQLRDGHGTERDPMPFRVLLDWIDRVEMTAPDTLAVERICPPGEYKGRFRNAWEPVFWFRRRGDPLPIFRDRLRRPAQYQGGTYSFRRPDGTTRLCKRRERFWPTADASNLWTGNVGNGNTGDVDLEAQGHPARWPYRLAADIVACFSDVGDLVVDPFLGGGTTLCAACDGDRRFLGGDLMEEWARKSLELADSRYSQLCLTAATG